MQLLPVKPANHRRAASTSGCQEAAVHLGLSTCCATGQMSVRRRAAVRRLRTKAKRRLDATRRLEALVYKRLRAMVPSVPKRSPVTRMQLLQHVLDYIHDLQEQLSEPAQLQGTPVTVESENPQFPSDVVPPLCR
uniref:BHLH domain-containing protein n=1 Tax=Trichuris muris TaxID=70415 RepID=A0A5S6QHK2_TRIMR